MESRNGDDITLEKLDRRPVLSVRATVQVAQLAEAQGEILRELWSSLRDDGVDPAGPPFVRYHTLGETETEVEIGVPVTEPAAGGGRVAAGELPAETAITTWHVGSHDRLGDAYGRLDAWLKERGRAADGTAWEAYWWIDATVEPDPSGWPPPSDWRTQLIQPIADSEASDRTVDDRNGT